MIILPKKAVKVALVASQLALMTACATMPMQKDTKVSNTINETTNMSGATLTEAQKAYNVLHYDLALAVFPETKTIDGTLTMTFAALDGMDVVEMDLDPRYNVTSVKVDGETVEFTHGSPKLTAQLASPIAAGSTTKITVDYDGRPYIAPRPPWNGGFVWSETEGQPWIATAVQGQGCDLWWPCKDNYGDKPDNGVDLRINVPEGVSAATNGVLIEQSEVVDGRHTFHWKSKHPYTGYAIAINIGPYERIQTTYKGINGTTMPVEFWAVRANADKARKLLETDAIPHLEFFERLIGPYPWGDEKVGFAETPHLGMEHQTINAYGAGYPRGEHGYDWLMHHELAHEWFGNVMTHASAADVWLHEGYAAHMQAVYAAEVIGDMAYADIMYSAYTGSENCVPVVQRGENNINETFTNGDIYTKGSWMLHTLRNYIGKDAFWDGTRRLIYGTSEPWDLQYPIKPVYRSTEDFIEIMSEEGGKDVAWLVKAYLYEADLPDLQTERDGDLMKLTWKTGGDRPFPMPVPIRVGDKMVTVDMSDGSGEVRIPKGTVYTIDPYMTTLRQLTIVAPCEERLEAERIRLQAREDRMAEEYGWQRDEEE